MGLMTIRGTSADLPVLPEEADLERVASLGPAGALVSSFEFGETTVRALNVKDARLLDGKIRSVRSERTSMTRLDVRSAEFSACELGSLRWAGGKISRTRMDYATLDRIRAVGPVLLLVRCSLREAEFTGCDLAGSLFDGCELFSATFGRGRYGGVDAACASAGCRTRRDLR